MGHTGLIISFWIIAIILQNSTELMCVNVLGHTQLCSGFSSTFCLWISPADTQGTIYSVSDQNGIGDFQEKSLNLYTI